MGLADIACHVKSVMYLNKRGFEMRLTTWRATGLAYVARHIKKKNQG